MSKIVVIVGPTGVGKTNLSIELAKEIDGVILNADSVQIFKDLNIGTSKITEEEKQGIKHYFIDLFSPDENYSVADYQREARDVLNILLCNNKNVIIVGGSGLYLKALLYNYKFEDKNNLKYNNYEELNNDELKSRVDLIYKDNNIHVNNRKRLVNFLNSYETNNKIIKNTPEKDELLYKDVIFIGLTCDREELYKRINNRVDQMFNDGLVEEVKGLYDKNIKRCLNVIGYKELYKYFDEEITLEEAKEQIKKNTRKYAKRQYTWFNNQLDIKWFNVDFNNFNNTVREVYDYLNKY